MMMKEIEAVVQDLVVLYGVESQPQSRPKKVLENFSPQDKFLLE